jgi:uncharacterized protein YndB with AHSA1/START domain
VELTETLHIARPTADVFKAWSRVDRAGQHNPAVVERRKLTEGAIGKGSRFRAVDAWPGRDVTYYVEITAFERPQRIAATWSEPMSGGWDAIFEASGGGTEVRFHATLNPSGLSGLMIRLLMPWYRRQVRAFLEAFRDELEGGSAGVA